MAITVVVALWAAVLPALCAGDGVPPTTGALDISTCEVADTSPEVALKWESSATAAARSPLTGALAAARYSVYVRDAGQWVLRVQVHVPDAGARPVARRAARLAASLWRSIDRRVGYAVPQIRQAVTHVYLERGGGGAGGENHQSDIYVMDFLSERSELEWVRTLCHEMGHYVLPGPGVYTDPEPWINGVLGERLFMRWLLDDLVALRLTPAALGYGSEADLRWYIDRQTDPLTERVEASGPDRAALADRGRRGGDAFCSLILYVDRYWGSKAIFDLLDFLPTKGGLAPDGVAFLTALESYLAAADRTLEVAPGKTVMAYVPAGKRLAASDGATALTVLGPGLSLDRRSASAWLVTARTGTWARLRLDAAGRQASLRWARP